MVAFVKFFLFLFVVFTSISQGMEEKIADASLKNIDFQKNLNKNEAPSNNEIYLIVGSARKEGTEVYINPFAKEIFGNKVDLIHRGAFNGKAVTLDIMPCALRDLPHIQADACYYTPPEGTQFLAVFMELFPSIKELIQL